MPERSDKYRNMSIFRAQSFLEQKHGTENIEKFQEQVVKTFSDASTALRKTYRPTNISLGEGAFGAVYLFESRHDPEMKYAVKIMVKESMDPEALQVAREEVAILAMFDHPNIVKYVESYEDNRYMYIVMEYLEQATELYYVIEKQKTLMAHYRNEFNKSLFPEEEIRRMMHMLMGGLHHIHSNGVIHRDLKPENCLIDKNLQLRIIDFGLSKMVRRREYGQVILGTPHYLAPEVFK